MNGSNSNTSGSTVVSFEYKPQASGDVISDSQMRELVRRLMGNITFDQAGDIYSGTTAPDDKTLIWWPADPTSGVRIGQPKTYDTKTATWIELGSGLKLPEFRKHVSGVTFFANTGGSAANVSNTISFGAFGGAEYDIALTPITRNDSAAFISPPANMNNFGAIVTAQADGQFAVTCFNVPAGGLGLRWAVTEINPDKV